MDLSQWLGKTSLTSVCLVIRNESRTHRILVQMGRAAQLSTPQSFLVLSDHLNVMSESPTYFSRKESPPFFQLRIGVSIVFFFSYYGSLLWKLRRKRATWKMRTKMPWIENWNCQETRHQAIADRQSQSKKPRETKDLVDHKARKEES